MKQNALSKIILSLAITSFTIWLGSYVARQLVVYQLFEPINLDLKNLYNVQNLTSVLETIFPILMLNLISYPAFLILFFVFIFSSKIKIKNEGWLFIILMLVIITAPFELYLSFLDYKVVKLLYESSFDSNAVVDLLRKRITALSSFPMIEVFSYVAAIFIAIFKPLRKNEN
ncbi:MAG: hypothetical protein M1495_00185 [Bacteroidetes bacterium]|nr:hypothetical protein [Bacteroidota bacterium]MCL6098294.1 hypothetical protein [Bacteroidota bacterium]